jgi:uncharacterized lipoprotein YajG
MDKNDRGCILKKSIIIFAALLIMTGCKTTTLTFVKNGADEQEQKKDKYQCKMEVLGVTKDMCNHANGWDVMTCVDQRQKTYDKLIKECLEARGYTALKR